MRVRVGKTCWGVEKTRSDGDKEGEGRVSVDKGKDKMGEENQQIWHWPLAIGHLAVGGVGRLTRSIWDSGGSLISRNLGAKREKVGGWRLAGRDRIRCTFLSHASTTRPPKAHMYRCGCTHVRNAYVCIKYRYNLPTQRV